MNEIWKDVKDFPSYEVSNLGNVRNKKTKRVLKGRKVGNYLHVALYKGDGSKPTEKLIHRLVAEAFLTNLENKTEINHKSGITTQNEVSNLEWSSAKENSIHRDYVLNHCGGFGKSPVRCIETEVVYLSQSEASRQTGIAASSISACCRGKRKTAGGFHWETVQA